MLKTGPAHKERSFLRHGLRAALLAGAAVLFGLPGGAAHAATLVAPDDAPDQNTLIQADTVTYDDDKNTVTASGNVEIQRGARILLADQIVYDRNTEIATATGHVAILEANGTVFFFENIKVTGDLKEGLATEVRVLLADKSRMASRAFRRKPDDVNELYEAVYTPCDSCDGHDPLWQLKARQVRYDRNAQMIYYNDAWLEIKGVPVFYTPYLAHPDPTAGAKTGLLLPALGVSRNLGAFYRQPYYIAISDDQDATIAPYLTSSAGKGAQFEYRRDFRSGQLRIDGSLFADDPQLNQDVRGHFIGWSRFDLDENWRTGTDINLATDQTFLRRYNYKAPTWLTSNVFAERFTENSYFSANAYYFENQRVAISSSSVPVVAPLLNYDYVSTPDSIGGYWNFNANSLVLFRQQGTDSNRLSGKLGWNLPYTSPLGALFTFRADVRADGYYVQNLYRPSRNDYFTGASGRAVPEASLEARMPFVSDALGFHQVLEPIAMLAASPVDHLNSENIPNEDSLDLEFDDTNLFSMQRFAGFDRVETGARLNYGVRWTAFNDSVGTLSAQFGEVYRFHSDPAFDSTSGLQGHLSDYVGHFNYTPNGLVSLQYRFRLDRDTFQPRRTEVTTVVGPDLARVGASYLFVKGDANTIATTGSTEELFVFLSSRFSQHWSINASHRVNLGRLGGTIRSELGITYEDECVVIGLDIANDNTQDRDFKRGLGVLLRLNLKTIGDIKLNTDIGARS